MNYGFITLLVVFMAKIKSYVLGVLFAYNSNFKWYAGILLAFWQTGDLNKILKLNF